MASTPAAGDRVAYAAKFLRSISAFTGGAPQRRGTYLGDDPTPSYGRVRWDDFEACAARLATQWGEDYVEDARQHGQLVHKTNVARVGSPRFASNDL